MTGIKSEHRQEMLTEEEVYVTIAQDRIMGQVIIYSGTMVGKNAEFTLLTTSSDWLVIMSGEDV